MRTQSCIAIITNAGRAAVDFLATYDTGMLERRLPVRCDPAP
jgi:hypothetical protein